MNNNIVFAEVLEILNNMEEVYIKKLPQKLMDFFKENASKDYKKHIVPYKDLKEQNLNKKTLSILAMLNLKYWARNEQHKKELMKKYKKNNDKIQYKNNIFPEKETIKSNVQEWSLVNVKKESLFFKIINLIKKKIIV